jgi:Ser/Thr protein kinase RdoA (MazF antagonist)
MDSDQAPVFRALSFAGKWEVIGYLRRGEAPQDPQIAAAAVEWAEGYQRQGPRHAAALRYLPALVVVVCGLAAIFFAADGDAMVAILNAIIALVNFGHLMINPVTRPQRMARSLQASKEVLASRE